jgi:hypothetical protein
MKTTYVATSTVYVTDKRGNVKVLKEGTAISAKDWEKLPSSTARAKFTALIKEAVARRVRSSSVIQDWTADQLNLMIQLYIENVDPVNQEDNRELITEAFLAQFPERNSSGIKMVIMQIKGHDRLYDAVGLQSSQLLRELLSEMDADRFPA